MAERLLHSLQGFQTQLSEWLKAGLNVPLMYARGWARSAQTFVLKQQQHPAEVSVRGLAAAFQILGMSLRGIWLQESLSQSLPCCVPCMSCVPCRVVACHVLQLRRCLPLTPHEHGSFSPVPYNSGHGAMCQFMCGHPPGPCCVVCVEARLSLVASPSQCSAKSSPMAA